MNTEKGSAIAEFIAIELSDKLLISLKDRWIGGIGGYLFNGKEAEPSYYERWYFVDKGVEKVSRTGTRRINQRYELAANFLSKESILSGGIKKIYESKEVTDSDGSDLPFFSKIRSLYEYRSDEEDYETIYDFKIEVICKINKLPSEAKMAYEVFSGHKAHVNEYDDSIYSIETKALLPEPLRPAGPCEMSSRELYKVIRAHIMKKVDGRYARITSNYDFCFTVKKVFGGKDRFDVFEMTHSEDKYKGYTVIPAIRANNKRQLKEKIDKLLAHLISVINKPLCECRNCNGRGYIDGEKLDTANLGQ